MRSMIRNVTVFGMLTAMVIGLSGCFQMMSESAHNNAVKKFPTYAETKASWDTIPEGYGRAVIFFKKEGINPFSAVNHMGAIFRVDKLSQIHVADQTFVFIDLPAGKHSIGYSSTVEFDILPGEVKYITWDRRWKVVTSQEAEPLLENIYHYYKKPLSFDKQEKSAEKVTY